MKRDEVEICRLDIVLCYRSPVNMIHLIRVKLFLSSMIIDISVGQYGNTFDARDATVVIDPLLRW